MSDPDAVARELLRSMPGDPAQSAEFFLRQPDESAWMTMEKAGGMRVNMLWEDPETGASVALLDVPEGAGIPKRHRHASDQSMYCLSGEYVYLEPKPELVLIPGSYYRNPAGNFHGPTVARTRCLLLETYYGPHYFEMPDYHTEETVRGVLEDKS